ncbi:MAG: hypothetical protein DMD35_10045 [Gemmatimonadetes bacterium]|nr:MAG: hypothetical protein DMD35_10045 [Gemmatimonadota bacterium]
MPSALDLRVRAARRHLRDDALRAEDIGIRYADARNAPHSGHFEGFASYDRTTDSCITAMLNVVARTHEVAADTVRASLRHRPVAGDALAMLSFAALFALVAYGVTGRVNRNFPLDGGRDSVVAVAAIILTSILVSGAAVMVGEWYAISLEVIRVGNGHLSYRTQRVPWTHHRTKLLVAGMALFWVMAALRRRIDAGRESDHATRWAGRPARKVATSPTSLAPPSTRVDRQ